MDTPLLNLMLPPTIAAILMGIQWLLWGREKYETIPVLYEPPEGLSILECGILMDDAVNTKDIALELYNLYLKNILILKGEDTFILNPSLDEKMLERLTPSQSMVLNGFIGTGRSTCTGIQTYEAILKNTMRDNAKYVSELGFDIVRKSYLKRISGKICDLKFQIYDFMTEQGYFPLSPFEQRKPYIGIGAVIFTGPLTWNLGMIFDDRYSKLSISWYLVTGLCLAGIIIAYASLFMVRKTESGLKAKAAFLGLREYIVTAESDRIKYVIENDIDAYRSLLPYAALFNSIEQWIAPLKSLGKNLDTPKFQDITNTITAMDVDISITEKSRWFRALADLFIYGSKILGGFSSRRNSGYKHDFHDSFD
jgi:hypothetical protein